MTCPSCLVSDASTCVTCLRGRCWRCLTAIHVNELYRTYYAPGCEYPHPLIFACASCLTEHAEGP